MVFQQELVRGGLRRVVGNDPAHTVPRQGNHRSHKQDHRDHIPAHWAVLHALAALLAVGVILPALAVAFVFLAAVTEILVKIVFFIFRHIIFRLGERILLNNDRGVPHGNQAIPVADTGMFLFSVIFRYAFFPARRLIAFLGGLRSLFVQFLLEDVAQLLQFPVQVLPVRSGRGALFLFLGRAGLVFLFPVVQGDAS